MYQIKKLTLALMILCSVLKGRSQNVTSPYSIGGIGDIENRNIGRTAGMASVSAAMRYNLNINVFNPASLTAMPTHLFLFEVGAKGRSSRFLQPGIDTTSQASTDFAVKRLSLAFKATKKMAFSIGLQPFSNTNYNFSAVVPLPAGNANYLRTVEGTGSMQQLYFSQALEVDSNFSIGYTFSYLFGSQHQNINYYDGAALNVTRQNIAYYRNPYFKAGLQYYSKPYRKVQHRIGAFASLPVTLNGSNTYNLTDGSTMVQDSVFVNNKSFKVPLMVTAGYSVTFNHSLTISADYNFNQWKTQTTPVAGLTLAPSNRVSLGFEKVNNVAYNGFLFEKYYFQGGIFYENTYWKVNNNYVNDMGFTLGAGTHIGRSLDGSGINVFGALEIGKRGSNGKGQIGDIYQQFTLGVTFFNFWQKSPYLKYN